MRTNTEKQQHQSNTCAVSAVAPTATTMSDFHDFGLTFFSKLCVFVLLKMSKNVFFVLRKWAFFSEFYLTVNWKDWSE